MSLARNGHQIQIIGRLGRDPELRYTANGTPVAHFSVASSRRWVGEDGQTVEETIWWRVTTWGKMAETCAKYLTKGRQVLVEGRLVPDPSTNGPRVWQGQDGSYRASFEVNADNVAFLGARPEGAGEDVTPEIEQEKSADIQF